MARTFLLSALMVLMLIPVGPASAATTSTDASSLLFDLLSEDRGASASEGSASFQASANFSDPRGDVTNLETRAVVSEDRADIISHDVDYTSAALTLRARVQSPTNPETDPAWRQNTLFGWFLDVDGDDEGEFFVDYSLTEDGSERIEVVVRTVVTGALGTEPCPGEPTGTFSGTSYIAVIPSDCIGDPASVASNPGFVFQAAAGERTVNDFAPNTGTFEAAVQVTPVVTDRLSGATRIETAVAISQYQFPNGAPTAYLARSDVFADAVAGGVLTDGPILLVPTCGAVPQIVLTEIARLGVDDVFALGGTAAVCDQVLTDATAAASGASSGRVAGPDRFSTAVAISQREFPLPGPARNAFLARADVFADAVAAGVLTSGPILLVPQCGDIPTVVLDEIQRVMPNGVYALGGQAAVCDATLAEGGSAYALTQTVSRLAGPTRIDTAVAISQFEFAANGADVVFLARQDVLADAVAAGSLTGGPVLLVPTCGDLPTAVAAEISRVGADQAIALGGINAICADMLTQAGAVISG